MSSSRHSTHSRPRLMMRNPSLQQKHTKHKRSHGGPRSPTRASGHISRGASVCWKMACTVPSQRRAQHIGCWETTAKFTPRVSRKSSMHLSRR
ncbi:hypothetical protein ATCV1_z601R [Acanthocystis turfacea chlorella virus 1]|uniref:Uncharacterized protein z601R n=1 Tax=Chlorovirus heliozoae TaxID=322019 RepID=A7K9L1_9PHYC|nr:hypothetical protein ATCV1_z601R [Acanthocystis turfacea chlorella virus 1]ABT16735.1 hypothetical protein ATCV1_z601R [Acanthocystis turfacea chlorella virus 1]